MSCLIRGTGAAVRAVRPVWPKLLASSIRDPELLCHRLGLSERHRSAARRAAGAFPLRVPLSFVARMRPGDPHDPLLRQVLPAADELRPVPGFTTDPLGELGAGISCGLIQKYHGRALLIATRTCAIHCRYCFRRHFRRRRASSSAPTSWPRALETLARRTDIEEVILSGGDPLTLPDRTLARLASQLERNDHLQRLRIHTRLPVVVPQRVDAHLLDWLTATRLRCLVVVHCNHPNEVDPACAAALSRLVRAGIPVLNQSVLLRGINDCTAVLAELCRRLVNLGVLPYYLHQLDRVAGAAHFEVSESKGRALVAELRQLLPGYAVPRYVREVPGAVAKVPLAAGTCSVTSPAASPRASLHGP